MTAARLRAGLIGLGAMGRHHLRVLQSLEDVDIVGVCDSSVEVLRRTSGIPAFATAEELLEQELDFCIVASPTDTHEVLGMQLATARVHALIEKPLASDVEAGSRLVNAFDSAGVIGCVGHIERFNPAVSFLHDRLSEGILGRIYQITTRRMGPFPGRIRDVGVIKDLAIHDFDLTAWVTGSQYESVAAQSITCDEGVHEDLVAVIGRLKDGTMTNHLVNWRTPEKDRSVTVVGEQGSLEANILRADLTLFSDGNSPAVWDEVSQFRKASEADSIRDPLNSIEPLLAEVRQFCRTIRGHADQSDQSVFFRDALQTLKVAEAVLDSTRSNGFVDVR